MPQERKPRLAVAALVAAAALALAVPAAGQDRPQPRIIGGTATTIQEWPWQVGIADPASSGGSGFARQYCGGTLITPIYVVTAAHCTYDDLGLITGFEDPENFAVISGRTVLSSNDGEETIASELWFFTGDPASPTLTSDDSDPPLYDPNLATGDDEWDAVVLELPDPVAAPAAPIQIAGAGEADTWVAGRDAFVTGWGNTQEGGNNYADTLREAQIHMLSDQACAEYRGGYYDYDPNTMVCAGEPGADRDTCQGDSGGPLVVPVTVSGNPAFRLVGDTSFGDGCGDGVPAVYGRLAGPAMRQAIAGLAPAAIGSGAEPRDIADLPGNPPKPPPVDPDPVDPGPDPDPTPRCRVPGLRGKTVPNARRTLRARHCRLGAVTRRRSTRFRRGRVIRQRPARGTRRAAGFRVRVVVSSGRR